MNPHFSSLLRRLVLASLGLLLIQSARPAAAESVVTHWNEATLQAVRETRPGPPMVARALAIVHTCAYDAWAAYDKKAVGTRFGAEARRPAAERTAANKEKAVSFAAYRALVDLFPQPDQVAAFSAHMRQLGYDPDDASTDPTTPAGIGNRCANAVLTFRHADGSNQLGDLHPGRYSDYTGYVAVNDPDRVNDPSRWQPLRVSDGRGGFVIQSYTAPHWGNVIPFALTESAKLRPGPPAQFGTAAFRRQAQEILRYSAQLTDVRKMIAEYWADGPASEFPPGHWALFSQYVSHREKYGVDQDVKLYFAVSNAMLDASIGCWECKRHYDYARPITVIRHLYAGEQIRAWGGPFQGTQLISGGEWTPYGQAATVITPPFPEYTSGHSTFSAAGAEVLKRFTGSDRFGFTIPIPRGSSLLEPGLTPARDLTFSFPTFTSAAAQAGMSRVYGGIHFMDANVRGQRMGRRIGVLVWEKAQSYFNGTAAPAKNGN